MQRLEVSGAVRQIYIYIYIYIYMSVCVCVCVCVIRRLKVKRQQNESTYDESVTITWTVFTKWTVVEEFGENLQY
jgi:hypothetical protein